MSEIIIEIDGILETILKNEKFQEIQKYVDVLAETGEFAKSLANLEREIIYSIKDAQITKNEVRKIGIKMFKVLKMLYNKNYKFKKVDGNQSKKLKDLLVNHLEEILTVLIIKALEQIKKHFPDLSTINLSQDDIELIVNTIIDTAELSINITKKKWSKWIPCCF